MVLQHLLSLLHLHHDQSPVSYTHLKQEHLEELIPYMCAMDFISADLMGGVLYRTGTLAEGAEKCDFYVCKKDSKWDKERKYGQQSKLQKQGELGKWNM